jgi:hypothetical protein
MASLKIIRAGGKTSVHRISPALEYAFEQEFKGGIAKILRDGERQSDIYWIAHKALLKSGESVSLSFSEFLDELESVEIIDDEKNG